ncbi:MAG TPA: SRPBCC family protein [Acidimicrobiales bacterium]|jgi:uncharacterized protein YndB with AHSA1/START domain
MDGYVLSVDRVIAAPPAELFAIVADANRHPEIDGSGSVIKTKAGTPDTLTLGSKFGMSMKAGVSYSMQNTVVEYEPERRIAWRTGSGGPLSRLVGGRIWRYDFEPVDGGTKVTESWDISRDKQRAIFKRIGKISQDAVTSMTKTLERLAEITEPSATP